VKPERVHQASRSVAQLQALYGQIHRGNLCINALGCRILPDPDRVRRRVIPHSLRSDIFLVGQALARDSQSRSGLPYHRADGSITRTGKALDTFLKSFGYSVAPMETRYAYSSDLVQHFPGATMRGHRKPTRAERENCAPWLREELAVVQPKVVILLGRLAASDFLDRYARGKDRRPGLAWARPEVCQVGGRRVVAIAIPHPSYRFAPRQRNHSYARASKRIRALLDQPDDLR
jgi:uracil-DNA glycosylase family 4